MTVRWPVWSVPIVALSTSDAVEQRRVVDRHALGRRRGAVGDRARTPAGRSGRSARGSAAELSTPGSSTTIRSVPWVVTTGSDTPLPLTRRSMISRMTPSAAGSGTRSLDGQRLVLDPRAALEVEPELRLDLAIPAVRAEAGQDEAGEEVDEEGEQADDEDEDRAGASHRGRMIQGTSVRRSEAWDALQARRFSSAADGSGGQPARGPLVGRSAGCAWRGFARRAGSRGLVCALRPGSWLEMSPVLGDESAKAPAVVSRRRFRCRGRRIRRSPSALGLVRDFLLSLARKLTAFRWHRTGSGTSRASSTTFRWHGSTSSWAADPGPGGPGIVRRHRVVGRVVRRRQSSDAVGFPSGNGRNRPVSTS